MKKYFTTLFAILLVNFIQGQKLESIDTVYMQDVRTLNTKDYKSKIDVNTLILEDGTLLKVGSSLILGNPSNSDYEAVENTAVNFTQIFGDRYSFMQSTACDGGLEPFWSNSEIIIQEIRLQKKSKDIIINFKLANGGKICTGEYGHILNFQLAYSRKEVVNINAPISKEDAMAKLLEAKNLFELEVMTQEEYDAIKKELSPILKGS